MVIKSQASLPWRLSSPPPRLRVGLAAPHSLSLHDQKNSSSAGISAFGERFLRHLSTLRRRAEGDLCRWRTPQLNSLDYLGASNGSRAINRGQWHGESSLENSL